MPRFAPRAFRAAILFLFFAVFVSTTAPSDVPAAPRPGEPSDSRAMALSGQLAAWIDGDANPAERTPIRQRIREEPESFEIFRGQLAGDERLRPLEHLPFGGAIAATAGRHGVDALLVAAIVTVESRFDPNAVSHRGAVGLMQILPTTAGVEEGLADPEVNLDAGVAYLGWLLSSFDGDLEMALAAYNAGPTNVRRHGGVPPFAETRDYVERVLEVYVGLNREAWQGSQEAALLGRAG